MNCQTFKAVVQEIDRPGGVEETMREDALTHAEGCPRCAGRLRSTRALAAALQALARADESNHAPARVEDEVRLAFRVLARRKPRPSRAAWVIAAAAAVVFAIGAGFLWYRAVAPDPGQTRGQIHGLTNDRFAAIPTPAASQPASGQTAKPAPLHETRTGRRPRHRPVQKAPVEPQGEPRQPIVLPDEEMAGFLPLPFADREEPIGAGALVRIQLSEGSLGMLGVPVTGPGSSQPVTADVLLGQDGSARAIRFISGPVPSGLGEQLQSMSFATKGAER